MAHLITSHSHAPSQKLTDAHKRKTCVHAQYDHLEHRDLTVVFLCPVVSRLTRSHELHGTVHVHMAYTDKTCHVVLAILMRTTTFG